MPLFLKRWKGYHNERTDRIAKRVYKALLVVGVGLSLASCVYSTIYAMVQSNLYKYTKDDWKMCLTWGGTPEQSFPGTAATVGIKSIVFLVVSFFAVNLGIRDHDLLPYGLYMSIIGMLGVLIYRESSPIQPEPAQLSATLLTLHKFVQPKMYDTIALRRGFPSAETCVAAMNFNVGFVGLQFAVFAVTVALFMLVVYTMLHSPRDYLVVDVVGKKMVLLLVFVTLGAYLVTLVAKEVVSINTLAVTEKAYNGLLAAQFVFKRADMDIMSMTMMVSCGATLVGVFHECMTKFRLAAFMAFLHVVISLPVVLSTFQGYQAYTFPQGGGTYDLWKPSQCHAYLRAKYGGFPPDKSVFDHFPSELSNICAQLPAALIGQLIIFGAMVLHIGACVRVLVLNSRFQRPAEETRCMSCAYRLEDEGYFTVEHQPTIIDGPDGRCGA